MDWIKCSEKMPDEHPSVFKRNKQWEKFKKDGFHENQSNDVFVTLEFEDGSRTVCIANTCDGAWHSNTIAFFNAGKRKCEVISWMPYPEPDNT